MSGSTFTFQPSTIGQLLKRGRLRVPANQRSYAWREKQVRYLLTDLHDAIFEEDSDDYFLGTIVIVESTGLPSIVDGQQRLATASILLARLRDLLAALGRDKSALSIEREYLETIDISSEESSSRIQMNDENNAFYNASILPSHFANRKIKIDGLRLTNRRLLSASRQIDKYLRDGLALVSLEREVEILIRWQKFIDTKARILAVFVSDEFSAYRMFETLNDRGLRASQVDILKNYLFSRCDTRLDEAKSFWTQIDTIIEPLARRRDSDEDDEEPDDPSKSGDPLIHFFRHFWVTRQGETKAKNLAEKIRGELTNEARVMQFLADAVDAARSYVASFRQDDPKWRVYPPSAKQDIETLNENLRINQIRPLLFAIAYYLEPKEAAKALQLCVSWSVRFLIVGGRGGMLDTQYSRRAAEIGTGKVTKARELREHMSPYVPSDEEFEQNFAVARVSRNWLARYLLRAIQKEISELPFPEYVANKEASEINLEHLLPLRLSDEWEIDPDIADASYNLLGNQFLISSKKNRDMGNAGFVTKKAVMAGSGYSTTNMVKNYDSWEREDILSRQKFLASHAIATWPLTFKP